MGNNPSASEQSPSAGGGVGASDRPRRSSRGPFESGRYSRNNLLVATNNFGVIDEEASEASEDTGPLDISDTDKVIHLRRNQPPHRIHYDDEPNSPVNFSALSIERKRGGSARRPPNLAIQQRYAPDPQQPHTVASSEPARRGSYPRPPKFSDRPDRSCTIDAGDAIRRRQRMPDPNKRLIPTVFKLYWPRLASSVFVAGSFNNWQLVPMHGSSGLTKKRYDPSMRRGSIGPGTGIGSGKCCNWIIIVDLPEGEHQYKFKVDDQWVHNPKEKTVPDGMNGWNNVIAVKKSDFEVFDALDMDCREVDDAKRERAMRNRRNRQRRTSEYTLDSIKGFSALHMADDDDWAQEIPDIFKGNDGGNNECGAQSTDEVKGPPTLPPHLLQVILNKDTPLACEPTLLPRPNHVMLDHMYALSIKDRVMIMCATKRFRKKYVTTVLYRPIE